jgi:protein tyrosine/serine phosphatase
MNKTDMRLYKNLVTIFVAIGFILPAFAESDLQVENFGKVSHIYYRGAQPKGNDYLALANLGVKTILNLTSHDADVNEQGLVEKAGMKYFQIPMNTRISPTAENLSEFLKIVLDPANQPVYVHCVGGKHRTGVMTAIYRMTQFGWTAEQAYDEMKKFKFGPSFLHPEFKKFVYDFKTEMVGSNLAAAEAK